MTQEQSVKQPTQQKIRYAAMGLLARREHTCKELLAKLTRSGHSLEAVQQVIASLLDEGLLSHERFAESYTRHRINRGYGPVRIRQELEQRGVEDHLIELALEAVSDEWSACVTWVREKKFGKELPQDYETKAKQMRFLQYRGFSTEQINNSLKIL